ncbi:hypothetical protein [Thiocapsa imhoffii]|nr:hypothetical protein [Thiocapsa imhoffii]
MVALVGSLVLVQWLWGRAWNRQWSFGKSPLVAVLSSICAVMIGLSTLFWFAADRSNTWLEMQRTELVRQFTESGTRNRRIFRTALERIGESTSVAENALELRNERDTLTLAFAAASDVSCPLASKGPLGPGAPCRVRDATTVAEEVVRNIPVLTYPITVSPQNRWVEAAVTAQLDEALSFASTRLRAGTAELRQALGILMIVLITGQLLMVWVAAISDIRVHPKV